MFWGESQGCSQLRWVLWDPWSKECGPGPGRHQMASGEVPVSLWRVWSQGITSTLWSSVTHWHVYRNIKLISNTHLQLHALQTSLPASGSVAEKWTGKLFSSWQKTMCLGRQWLLWLQRWALHLFLKIIFLIWYLTLLEWSSGQKIAIAFQEANYCLRYVIGTSEHW